MLGRRAEAEHQPHGTYRSTSHSLKPFFLLVPELFSATLGLQLARRHPADLPRHWFLYWSAKLLGWEGEGGRHQEMGLSSWCRAALGTQGHLHKHMEQGTAHHTQYRCPEGPPLPVQQEEEEWFSEDRSARLSFQQHLCRRGGAFLKRTVEDKYGELSSPQDADPQQTLHPHLLVRQQDPAPLCNMTELSSALVLLIFSGHCGLTEGWWGERTLRTSQPVPAGTRVLWGSAGHHPRQRLGKMPSHGAEHQLQHGSTALLRASFPQGHFLGSYVCQSC